MKKRYCLIVLSGIIIAFLMNAAAFGLSDAFKNNIYNPGKLKPTDSVLKVKTEIAPLILPFPQSPERKYLLADTLEKRMWSFPLCLPHGRRFVRISGLATTL